MRIRSFATTLTLPVVAFFAFVATPIRARANDFPTPFGFHASAEKGNYAQATGSISDDRHEAAINSRSMGIWHENHLGGEIAGHWDDWNMNEDEGPWRHHDDDGEEDDHEGGKTSVPEPSTALMLASGLSALAGWRLRYRA
jgi:hypothetical protein